MEYRVVINLNGTFWYKPNSDILHREDGPAAEYSDGTKMWYQYDKIHRIGGPAIECSNGTKEWYLNGKMLSEEKFNLAIKKDTTFCDKVIEIEGVKYKLTPI